MAWKQQDVTDPGQRPGVYTNFIEAAQAFISGGITGVVAATVTAAWGKEGEVVEITTTDDIRKYFTLNENYFEGIDSTDAAEAIISNRYSAPFVLKSLLEGGASRVLAYRVVGGTPTKASITLKDNHETPASRVNSFIVTSKYSGKGGDSFSIQVGLKPESTDTRITLYDPAGLVVGTWDGANVGALVTAINNDEDNDYITAAKATSAIADTTVLLAISKTNLAGGNGDEKASADALRGIKAGSYTAALPILSQENFEFMYLDTNDSGIKTSYIQWINSLQEEGKYRLMITGSSLAQAESAVITEATGRNNPAITHIYPGVKQKNYANLSTTYPGYLAAAKITGLASGLPLVSSPTFKTIPGIEDLEVRPSNEAIKGLLAGNVMPLVWNGRRLRLERAITTFNKSNSFFKKLKVVRILYSIANAINASMDEDFIGEINVDDAGIDSVFSTIGQFLTRQVSDGLIEDEFTIELDPDNPPFRDRFFTKIGIVPIDSAEYMYFTVAVGRAN